MPCYSPLEAFRKDSGEVVFHDGGGRWRPLLLSCGQCVGCRIRRSQDMAIRCMHEASLHELNSFVTLTYRDDELPPGGSLVYRDFQLFVKRARKRLGKFRFYMCGEYGERSGRPHFHAILFGLGFSDRYHWRTSPGGHEIFRSPVLESLWTAGNSEIGSVTFESAQYVAGYVHKKVFGSAAADHYRRVDVSTGEIVDLVPEFARMSLKPGIGADWFRAFSSDVYPEDFVVVNGRKARPPRYYDKLHERFGEGHDLVEVEFSRYELAQGQEVDSSADRLRVREIVARARISLGSKSL